MSRPFLFRSRALIDPAAPAVVADPSHIPLINRRVIHVVNDRDVHVVDRAIVEEASIFPTAAFIAMAKIAVPVVDPAIESDHRPPISFIENKSAAAPTPITRSPQKTDLRRQHPSPRNPIIIVEV